MNHLPMRPPSGLAPAAVTTASAQDVAEGSMCCGQTFQSEGVHNRMCNECRKLSVHPYELDE